MDRYGISDALKVDFEGINNALLRVLAGKTLVISGATGFVGSLLARLVIWANDARGLGCDLVLCARKAEKLEVVMPGLAGRSDVATEDVDFSSPCEPFSCAFDYLVHTAAITSSKMMVKHPADVLDVSINGAKWALESTRMHPGSKAVLLSSMEACGSFDAPTDAYEDTMGAIDMTSVRSCYPEGKRVSELMCLAYASQYGVNAVIGRLAQTFGAGVLPSEGRVFKQLAESAMDDKPIVLHTDGMSEGNYVYSTDALAAILILLEKGKTGQTYNVANEACHTTIRGMAELVARKFGGDGCSVIVEGQGALKFGYAEPTRMTLRSDKLRELGWEPKVGLEEAYGRLIEFLRPAHRG